MRVLVACEYSGAVRRAFRALGHDAWSCDLIPSDDNSEFHMQRDVFDCLALSGREHRENPWQLLIAFPPCTYLCSSGMHWTTRGLRDPGLTEKALWFVENLLNANVPHIALENPIGAISTRIRKPDQIIHPWQFGHPESKSTCLWLKNLPLLVPTNILQKPASGRWENQCAKGSQNKLGPSPDRWKLRSKTYMGIAEAMASQWSASALSALPIAAPAPIAESLFAWSAQNTTRTANASDLETPMGLGSESSKKTAGSTEYVLCEPDPAALIMLLSRTR